MKEISLMISGVVSIILDKLSGMQTPAVQPYDIHRPIFTWIKPRIKIVGGQKILCHAVAYQNMRTRRISIHPEYFKNH